MNPATEDVFAHVPVATHEQLEDAVAAAERAFPGWRDTPWEARQQALSDIAALLERHEAGFIELLMREVGKDRVSACVVFPLRLHWHRDSCSPWAHLVLGICRAFELSIAVPWLRAVAEQRLEDEVVQQSANRVVKNRFRPYGVVGSPYWISPSPAIDASYFFQVAGITPFK